MNAKTKIYGLVGLLAMVAALVMPSVQAGEKSRVVYHVADEAKVRFALGNIKNHIKGVGGPDNVEIVLVVHGPGLQGFHDIQAADKVRSLTKELQDIGVQFNACGNTMRAQEVEVEDLIPGFIRVDQGGVVRIAELQAEGYLYIRP